MTNITLDGLPPKTGTISDAGIIHYREGGTDKKMTVSDFLIKISEEYSTDINTFLGAADKAAGRVALDTPSVASVQDGQFTALGLTGGAADAYTASPTPAITAYTASMEYSAKIHATNLTTTPTLLISGISGGTIKKLNASKAEIAVEASDMLANGWYNFKRNVANDAWILLNPEKAYVNLVNGTGYAVAATESVAGIALLPKRITVSNGTDADHDINFTAGVFQFDDGTGQAVASAITKQIDATWAAGTAAGGLFSGTVANNTWYHCFAIYNPSTGVSDCGFDTSLTAANAPSGFTKYKRLGSVRTEGSANIRNFIQTNNYFYFVTPILDVNASYGTSRTSVTVTTPLGVRSIGLFNIYRAGADHDVYISSLDTADLAPSQTIAPLSSVTNIAGASSDTGGFGVFMVQTNTSSQIGIRSNTAASTMRMAILGYIDLTL